MKRKIVSSAFVLGLLLLPGISRADVVFSNFGAGMTFDTSVCNSYFVNGANFTPTTPCLPNVTEVGPESIAVQFMPSAAYNFQDAQLAAFLVTGTNSLDVYLETGSTGLPGSIISGFQVSGQLISSPSDTSPASIITVGSSEPGVTLLTGTSNPMLNAGTPYWLVAFTPVSDTVAAWSFNSDNDVSIGSSTASNLAAIPEASFTGSWIGFPDNIVPAFQIDGTPVTTPPPPTVPEPGSFILWGTALAGLALCMMRRRLVKAEGSKE